MTGVRPPTCLSMEAPTATATVADAGVAPVQDALCALRLAIWTLERATGRRDIDKDRLVDMIVRRAEEVRGLLAEAEARERAEELAQAAARVEALASDVFAAEQHQLSCAAAGPPVASRLQEA